MDILWWDNYDRRNHRTGKLRPYQDDSTGTASLWRSLTLFAHTAPAFLYHRPGNLCWIPSVFPSSILVHLSPLHPSRSREPPCKKSAYHCGEKDELLRGEKSHWGALRYKHLLLISTVAHQIIELSWISISEFVQNEDNMYFTLLWKIK